MTQHKSADQRVPAAVCWCCGKEGEWQSPWDDRVWCLHCKVVGCADCGGSPVRVHSIKHGDSSNARDGDGVAYAMAEDGTVLGSHLCSHWGYMRHDLHDRADRKARCEEHYPDGYRLVILGASELPPADVLERNRQQAETAHAAQEAGDGA